MTNVRSKPKLDGMTPSQADPLFGWVPSNALTIFGYVASFAMTAIAAVVAVGVDSQVSIPNLSLIFVVPVVVAAVWFGLGPSLASAVLGALAYNFFLTEPRYSLVVDDPANIWAIGLLFVVGIVVSGVAFTSGRRAAEATLLSRQMALLRDYSQNVAAAGSTKESAAITALALTALFQRPSVVMLVKDGKVTCLERGGGIKPRETELEAARSSLETRTVARAGLYPDLTSRFDFWPVPTAASESAVIGVAFDLDDRPSTPETLVDTVGSILRLVLDHHSLTKRDHDRA